MKENRTEPRINMSLPIVAWWEDAAGKQNFSHGKLEDISNAGLRFRTRDAIPVGTKLFLRTPMGEYVGTIVRSSQDGEELNLGIRKISERKPSGKHEKLR
ncbi:MAG TPA: PilZ domain-containing protein [Candidatus Acidoferrales bacterium]|jgi:hypothetical protein|nr:PilZ domain-containing protein [Candidatus Acidoferrales bacterium]